MAGRRPEHSDVEVLRLFEGGPPVRFTAEIAEQLGMSPQGAHKRLDKLRERGLINEHDPGTSSVWWPTEEGRERIKEHATARSD